MDHLKIEELEPRIVPSTLSVIIPADTAEAGITVVPPDGADVNAAAEAADGANGVTVS